MAATFGDRSVAGSDDDLFRLLAQAQPATLPPLYLSCGSEDALIGDNRRFIAAAAERGVALTSEIAPGEHEWGCWDAGIRDVLDWLPLRA